MGDHFERAKRLEELPLLKAQFDDFKEEAKTVWEEQEKERIEMEKTNRTSDVKNKERLIRMKTDKEKYLESLLKERKNIFEKKQTEFETLVANEKKERLQRRKEERMEERRQQWMEQKEEEERQRKEEIARREEEERKERERIQMESEFETLVANEKKERLQRRKEERMEERRQQWMEQKEEEERQ